MDGGNQQDVKIFANTESQRFEAKVDQHTAFLQYYVDGNSIVFTHTKVPEEIEGRGIGSALSRAGLDYARQESLSVVPLCPFVEEYIRRHPRELSLVEQTYRERAFPS